MRLREFIDEADADIIDLDFKRRQRKMRGDMSDEEKYDMAVADQQAKGDYEHPAYDPIVARDMEKLGGEGPEGTYSEDELIRILKNAGLYSGEVDENSSANARALVGSGRADPSGKKTNPDSPAHKKVRTPGTTYTSKRHKKQDWPATKHGANPGFVGG